MTIAHKIPLRWRMLCLLWLLALPLHARFAGSSPKRELRAVWLTTLNGLDWPRTRAVNTSAREQQQAELCQTLDALKAAGFNTILFQTRVRGTVVYPSDIEPWDGALTGTIGEDPGYDPLQFAIDETHRRGMELHAWVVTIPCFKAAVARQMGAKSVLRTHPKLCIKHGDTYYLDPGQPETADYLVGLCHELVSRYDVDGLHFDYIRYPENAASFPDAATFKKFAPQGQSKAEWRRENITHIVRSIYEDVHRLKPWVRVSSSPVGKHADLTRYSSRGWNARDAVHQDAQRWLSEGIHDILFPMMYFDGSHFYPFAADWQEQSAGRLVAPGLGVYLLHAKERDWPLGAIQRQLRFLRSEGLAGQCYFRSRFLTDNVKGVYDFLCADFYAYPALPPACTWLDSVPPTVPTALAATPVNAYEKELTWKASADGSGGGVRYNVYASAEWPVDVSRAENLVAALLSEPRYRYDQLYATRRHLHFAVTAIDRVGNESDAAQASQQPMLLPRRRLHIGRSGQLVFEK